MISSTARGNVIIRKAGQLSQAFILYQSKHGEARKLARSQVKVKSILPVHLWASLKR